MTEYFSYNSMDLLQVVVMEKFKITKFRFVSKQIIYDKNLQ